MLPRHPDTLVACDNYFLYVRFLCGCKFIILDSMLKRMCVSVLCLSIVTLSLADPPGAHVGLELNDIDFQFIEIVIDDPSSFVIRVIIVIVIVSRNFPPCFR